MIDTTQIDSTTDASVDRGSPAASRPPGRAGHDEEFPLELRATTIGTLCRSALTDVAARFPHRVVEYAPEPEPDREGAGEWDPRRVAYAVTILLEDALKRTSEDDPISLRWREHEGVVVLRVQYPRPLERGDRFVTYFEEGVRPDGADDGVGTLRILAALRIVRQHRGHLARIRTRSGTAYVVELPRSVTADALDRDDAR